MKNATFNFNFGGAPLPPRRSSRKTPTELPPRPSSRRTPQQLAPRTSTRKTPAALSTDTGQRSSTRNRRSASIAESAGSGTSNGPSQAFKTPAVTGKRKRGSMGLAAVQELEQDELEPTEEDIEESRGQGIRQSIEGPFGAIEQPSLPIPVDGDEEDDDELSPPEPSRSSGAPTPTATTTIQTPSLPAARGKQRPVVERRVSQKLVRGRSRTRKSVTAASASFATAQEDAVSDDELSPRNQNALTVQSTSGAQGSTSAFAVDDQSTSIFAPNNQSTRREIYEAVDTEEDELTPHQPKNGKTLDEATEENADVGASDDELSPKSLAQSVKLGRKRKQPAQEPMGEDDLSQEPQRQHRRRGRPSGVPIQVREDTAQDHANDDELSPQQGRPNKQRRPPLSKTNANAPKSQPTPKTIQRVRSPAIKKRKTTNEASISTGTVPIVVYRRKNPQDIDDDPLGADPTPGLNPADVLAQMTGELIRSYIKAFETSQTQIQSQSNKKTRQRQTNALRAFRDNLDDSLFDLTITHNSAYILAMRVRKAHKEKRRLREELIAKRREREDVELRIDAIRGRKQEKMEKEMRVHDLVQGLEDIELAVHRGREKARREGREDEGPEMSLEMVAGDVFEMIGNGGILRRVRDWNGILEDAARRIEGKA
jgi:hypothetical protein